MASGGYLSAKSMAFLFRCCIQDLKYALYPESGWQRLVSDLEIHPIAGAHFSILKEPRIQSIAQELKLCL
jgi:thioesterase domain-containing protein